MASATTRGSSLSLPPNPFCQRELVHNLKGLLRMDQWNVRYNPSDSVDGDGSHCHRDATGFSVSSLVVLWDSLEYYISYSHDPQEGIWNFDFFNFRVFMTYEVDELVPSFPTTVLLLGRQMRSKREAKPLVEKRYSVRSFIKNED